MMGSSPTRYQGAKGWFRVTHKPPLLCHMALTLTISLREVFFHVSTPAGETSSWSTYHPGGACDGGRLHGTYFFGHYLPPIFLYSISKVARGVYVRKTHLAMQSEVSYSPTSVRNCQRTRTISSCEYCHWLSEHKRPELTFSISNTAL